MISYKILVAAAAVSLITLPSPAQTTNAGEQNGHHYSGGPKTEVPHHMGKKDTSGSNSMRNSDGGHHYGGGPKTESHHMGTKQ